MSNGYALAAVTAVLRSRLNHHLIAAGLSGAIGDFTVSALPPDRIPLGAAEPTQLNVFLYQVSPNQAWRNVNLPATDSAGASVDAPPLGLDLHYLLTAYGPNMFVGEIVLGHALRALNDEPVLDRDVIRAALNPAAPDPTLPPVLQGSGLADQVEQIRLSPTVMTPEELSKLWSALQAHYRPTACYEVRVVVIDSTRSRRRALPVSGPAVAGLPPVLDAVENAGGGPASPITAASSIVLRGRGLNARNVVVALGGADHTPAVGNVTPGRITVDLAAVGVPLRAGWITAQVRTRVLLGDPATPHAAFPSNTVPFLLLPTITAQATVTGTETIDGVQLSAGHIDITVTPKVTARQRLTLLLNEFAAPAARPARAVALAPPDGNGVPDGAVDTGQVVFAFGGVPSANYLVRLSVDGAESPLSKDGSGRYALPAVTL